MSAVVVMEPATQTYDIFQCTKLFVTQAERRGNVGFKLAFLLDALNVELSAVNEEDADHLITLFFVLFTSLLGSVTIMRGSVI